MTPTDETKVLFDALSAAPTPKLFEYLPEKEHSIRRRMAEWILEHRLQDRANELEIARLRTANGELEPRLRKKERRETFTLVVAVVALAWAAVPHIYSWVGLGSR